MERNPLWIEEQQFNTLRDSGEVHIPQKLFTIGAELKVGEVIEVRGDGIQTLDRHLRAEVMSFDWPVELAHASLSLKKVE